VEGYGLCGKDEDNGVMGMGRGGRIFQLAVRSIGFRQRYMEQYNSNLLCGVMGMGRGAWKNILWSNAMSFRWSIAVDYWSAWTAWGHACKAKLSNRHIKATIIILRHEVRGKGVPCTPQIIPSDSRSVHA
jgi:hypothetical protein